MRKKIRFSPDPGTYAMIERTFDGKTEKHPALIVNESEGGCGLVTLQNFPLEPGEECVIEVGKLDKVTAKIAWRQSLDNDVVKVGVEYLE